VRKIIFEGLKMSLNDHVEEFGRTVGEELLAPTKIYVRTVLSLLKNFQVFGISHITGGGIIENLPRILPSNCQALISRSSWTPQPIFHFVRKAGNITDEEMMRTFNMGIGLIIVVAEKDSQDVMQQIEAMGEKPFPIGWIEERGKGLAVKFID